VWDIYFGMFAGSVKRSAENKAPAKSGYFVFKQAEKALGATIRIS